MIAVDYDGRPVADKRLFDAQARCAKLEAALDITFTWLTTNAIHPPTCRRSKQRTTPDGPYYSGLGKNFGGRYLTDEERELIPCSCGLDDVHNLICQSATKEDAP